MTPLKIKTITEAHRILGLPAPEHPLISLLNYADLKMPDYTSELSALFDFYYISLKKGFTNKLFYGQQTYDFDEGMLYFVAPNQILRGAGPEPDDDLSGWVLLIHPDFLWGTSLAKTIRKYDFFSYTVHEALFLSEKEKSIVNGIVANIQTEYRNNIDTFSQNIIISHLETLLNYAERFYQRQFLTRKKSNHQVLDRLEQLMTDYFHNEALLSKGLPTVQYISDNLNISQSYLRGLLKTLTGLSTQQYIHEKLIEKAKEKLSTTSLSVSEIAYELGFEHPQSFSKLFKDKTSQTPLAFREQFN
ncbi:MULTISPECIES: helix-turn-helix domain-containing protein [unclassified Spirosoma]|uniref:helix-turn-helix domain-containing protein n=1 Tax=unclassified Spirosoma TaxID=2621999 RepID=UPI0009679C64|nr:MULTISPECIES: helix-turn-helix domain-containing protein [unclassified Spirosoma]MBN8822647.1 helix-turn-helix domain-containing protein [Spirosoma sp.]OJW74136.1 MAG: AraC family transcriptional regulator [Spirosoma sp. 48-14]